MGQPSIYHATVALSFQIEICNLDRTKSSFLATSLYKKVIFIKHWVTRSCRPSDYVQMDWMWIDHHLLASQRVSAPLVSSQAICHVMMHLGTCYENWEDGGA